ncbi:MAG TPA: L,D-transpeptidase [Anaerolineae bacterium]|nr:L,D-transpeptidase [Anaerolineae bacterium]
MATVSRRNFLRFAGAALATPLIGPHPPDPAASARPFTLGRVTDYVTWAYADPKADAAREKSFRRDTVLKIYDSVTDETLLPHNPVWNLTPFGWVHAWALQPVAYQPNRPVRDVPEAGFWAQVTVPYVAMRSRPDDEARLLYRLYYSTVHLVIAHSEDARGRSWYQLRDDQQPNRLEYVRAEGLRRIRPEEMTPISPDAEDKVIEVSIKEQMVYAYENGSLVFSTQCATGAAFTVEGLGVVNFSTPYGEHSVVRKRPSRHMIGFLGRSDAYDLPGVPFCTYFTTAGAAIHGAYWHNDYGHPRSHGCVNVLPEAAQWVYRWTMPAAAYEDALLEVESDGSPIIVS